MSVRWLFWAGWFGIIIGYHTHTHTHTQINFKLFKHTKIAQHKNFITEILFLIYKQGEAGSPSQSAEFVADAVKDIAQACMYTLQHFFFTGAIYKCNICA